MNVASVTVSATTHGLMAGLAVALAGISSVAVAIGGRDSCVLE
jgi:hypothetical protein